MARNKENFNDKLGKWLAFGNELDTSKMRDLTKEEEENCIEIDNSVNNEALNAILEQLAVAKLIKNVLSKKR